MLHAVQEALGSQAPSIAIEQSAPDISLSDISKGNAPATASSSTGLIPLSLKAIQDSGAFPVDAAQLRSRRLKRASAEASAYLTLDRKSLRDTHGERLLAAYRIITASARITGDLPQAAAMLAVIPPEKFYVPSPSPFPNFIAGSQMPRSMMEHLSGLADSASTFIIEGEAVPCAGITLLPPPVPDYMYPEHLSPVMVADFRTRGFLPEGYNPEVDKPLSLWLTSMKHLSEFLGVEYGTEASPEKGLLGTLGLFHPNTARLAWPSRDDLLNFETELMFRTAEMITGASRDYSMSPEEQLTKEYGFSRVEALLIRKAGEIFAGSVYKQDPESLRYKEARMLEYIADTSMEAGDPRASLAAHKQKQQLLGLTRHDDTENMQEFREEVRKVLKDSPEDEPFG